jgi:predicted O-methyltransferase YrrM
MQLIRNWLKKHPSYSSIEEAPPGFREKAPLQLHDLVLNNASFFESAESLLRDTVITRNPKLNQSHFYPVFYDSNTRTITLLEEIIAKNRPINIVETGVANGVSTRAILSAFQRNSLTSSKLHSFDIDPRVAVSEFNLNPQFSFHLVTNINTFSDLLRHIPQIDLFYHDSDHSYENQMMEYREVWPKISSGGILMSDDVNWSNAFLDFCLHVDRKPYILCDTEKFSGIIYK